MYESHLSKQLFLPELKLIKRVFSRRQNLRVYYLEKSSEFEVCPKCGTKSFTVYDRVNIRVKDAPLRNKRVELIIRKRRYKCPSCRSIFRKPVPGIRKGYRTTQRFRKHVMWCCSHFMSLKRVAGMNHCSE